MTSAPALRPMLPEDVPVLAAIFVAAIEELTSDDYSEAQQVAWAGVAEDEAALGKKLAGQLTLVATLRGAPVGFASLKSNDTIDMLYVHPDVAEQGVAAMLCDALEKLAAARGTAVLKTDSSDTAQGFFLKRGYAPMQRNSISIDGEWLANTTMQKTLAAPAGNGEGA